MIDPKALELHDAQLVSVDIRPDTRQVIVKVIAYLSASSRDRGEFTLLFQGVSQLTQCMDFDQLEQNSWAGNINYWKPSTSSGHTYIYLVDGIITVHHERIIVDGPPV